MAWYNFGITKTHPPDDGIDIGTPSRTPLSFPFDCDVIDARWYVYGGQVACAVPGTGYSEYFIHMNNIYVRPGDEIPAGQTIGDSGGGVGDLLLHNGKVQPAKYQSWYEGHSSGPHSEYGIFQGQDMGEFNKGWHNPPRQLNPTSVYEALRAGQVPQWPGKDKPTNPPPGGQGGTGNPLADALLAAVEQLMTDSTQALGAKDWADGIRRGAFMAAAVGVVAFGGFVFLSPYLKAAAQEVKVEVGEAVGTATKAAAVAA